MHPRCLLDQSSDVPLHPSPSAPASLCLAATVVFLVRWAVGLSSRLSRTDKEAAATRCSAVRERAGLQLTCLSRRSVLSHTLTSARPSLQRHALAPGVSPSAPPSRAQQQQARLARRSGGSSRRRGILLCGCPPPLSAAPLPWCTETRSRIPPASPPPLAAAAPAHCCCCCCAHTRATHPRHTRLHSQPLIVRRSLLPSLPLSLSPRARVVPHCSVRSTSPALLASPLSPSHSTTLFVPPTHHVRPVLFSPSLRSCWRCCSLLVLLPPRWLVV